MRAPITLRRRSLGDGVCISLASEGSGNRSPLVAGEAVAQLRLSGCQVGRRSPLSGLGRARDADGMGYHFISSDSGARVPPPARRPGVAACGASVLEDAGRGRGDGSVGVHGRLPFRRAGPGRVPPCGDGGFGAVLLRQGDPLLPGYRGGLLGRRGLPDHHREPPGRPRHDRPLRRSAPRSSGWAVRAGSRRVRGKGWWIPGRSRSTVR